MARGKRFDTKKNDRLRIVIGKQVITIKLVRGGVEVVLPCRADLTATPRAEWVKMLAARKFGANRKKSPCKSARVSQ